MFDSELFYIQDTRSFYGNGIYWWAEGGKGYTADLLKAGKFTREEAEEICKRETDKPWPCSYIDNHKKAHVLTVDMQYLDYRYRSLAIPILELPEFEAIPFGSVFKRGVAVDGPDGLNMTKSGKMLRWVAIKGEIHDWAIYCYYDEPDIQEEFIVAFGTKVLEPANIRHCINCSNEVLSKYRR